MSHKLLTIAIPSFNGQVSLPSTIESVVFNLPSDILEQIEIVVSDNASTDGTQAVLAPLISKYSGLISYYRNEENVGFDRNVNKAVNYATAPFVWLLGNSDTLRPGAIERVLFVIQRYPDLAVVFVNCDGHDMPSREDGYCLDKNEFVVNTQLKSVFVSCNVVAKKLWQECDLSMATGTGYIHIGYLLQALVHHPSYVIYHSFVIPDKSPQAWGAKGKFLIHGLQLIGLFSEMKHLGYKNELVVWATSPLKLNKMYFYYPLAVSQGLSVDTAIRKKMFRLFKSFPSFWLLIVPQMLIPAVIYRMIRKCFLIVRTFFRGSGKK